MHFSDTMLGGMLLAFAAALAGYSWTLPAIPGQEYGAATFPVLIATGFAACGILLLARGWRSGGPLITRTEWTRQRGAMLAVIATIGLVVAYILLAHRIGFMPVMALVLAALFRLLGVAWWQTVVLSIATTLVIDFVFRSFLLVPLPLGLMPRPLW